MYFISKLVICFYIILIAFPIIINSISQGQLVDKWAKRLGKELNSLGLFITKAQEIEDRYRFNNAQVQKKDPKKILNEILGNVTKMLSKKMDAIKCIARAAEDEADSFKYNSSTNFTYHSSKYSSANGIEVELPESIIENKNMYEPMEFNVDSHFYNLSVNTSYSSVHVPTNIYDGFKEPATAIQWSESLDEVFRKNYESDPALSWQYFGSSTGIMRNYPAMRWAAGDEKDDFDCRVRTWYIEAATCTKDIVILLDSSGSMLGMNKHIASMTIYTILQTLSNNDYVNILNYSVSVNYTVPCFEKKLVQATPENIEIFKQSVNNIIPQGKSFAEKGLIESFHLLASYREIRNCTDECSQAIMLITDGVAQNYSELIKKYNCFDNDTIQPVRIFTYLIGKEINKIDEIASIACKNRGYFTIVTNLETVTEAVFKYVNVIARPLILHKKYPISWTHTSLDTHTRTNPNETYRLLTSAAIPVYNKSEDLEDDIHLLGVAGTDVTISSIRQLTFPYKLGVNAHGFIVTNNGYVLMHPGLRPMFKKKPTPNYNSIDFTEVQQLDDGSEPRELAQILLDLRADLIHGNKSVTKDIPLKYHYNNMQRVSREKFDFYYQSIKRTPFTMALALPNRFGYYAVQVPDEIHKNKHARVPIQSFFDGDNWKIHPEWIYCKYHYLEGHEFTNPEEELRHFLGRMYNKNFTWTMQYSTDNNDEEDKNIDEDDPETVECDMDKKRLQEDDYYCDKELINMLVFDAKECDMDKKRLQEDDYYCDKELINMLVFDAKSTLQAFKEPWTFKNDREELLFRRYNATLRFVATMSGLTRWEYIFGEANGTSTKEFGDDHPRAIDETWYKSAVLQHQYDIDSFVYSVPLQPSSTEDLLITGSYAIFPKDAGIEAPASVVGFQFSHSHLAKSFFDIAVTQMECPGCQGCGNNLDCYIIDSSGYILVSHDDIDTGTFFGKMEGCVFESMLELNIFDRVPVYDYQSLCYRMVLRVTKADKCNFSWNGMSCIFNWILENIFWVILNINLYQTWHPIQYTVRSETDNLEEEDVMLLPTIETDDLEQNKTNPFVPCDHKRNLYVLNQNLFINGVGFPGEIKTQCSTKRYFIKLIPRSNLILVAIIFNYTGSEKQFSTEPEMVVYNEPYPCQKLQLNELTRRRLSGCFNTHEDEEVITACGYVSATLRCQISFPTILMSILFSVKLLLY
ncbi:Neuronal voltage-dependent calcium channel alpha 2acd [Popillia japonica]|uniref:Neuronal voltage-dependent calcium channel alpha 2acd n=1 Tax=Popillia japonica TaxID=7064 RepID=A0AAW1I969_POPJA